MATKHYYRKKVYPDYQNSFDKYESIIHDENSKIYSELIISCEDEFFFNIIETSKIMDLDEG